MMTLKNVFHIIGPVTLVVGRFELSVDAVGFFRWTLCTREMLVILSFSWTSRCVCEPYASSFAAK